MKRIKETGTKSAFEFFIFSDFRKPFHLCFFALTFCLLFFAIACGKRRPPIAPVERVPQRTEALSGAQRGNQVYLNWPAPQRNAPDTSVQSIRRVDVYRLAERPDAPLPLTEEEFSARATLIGSVTYESILSATDGTITYIDKLELGGEPTRLRYALRYVNAAGQRAGFSNFLMIEPAARIAQPPTLVGQADVSETAITIRWQPPAANIDNSTPVNLLGYNIYRFDQSQTDSGQTPINTTLVSGTEYSDKNFRFGEKYNYIVRSVSLGTNGAQVESLNSNTIAAEPKDIFKPAAPGPVTIAAAPGRLSLFFPANTEPDVAGYNIFRSTDPNLAKEGWTKLNGQLLTRTTFQDETVEAGKRYYYYVVAVDTSGNVSAPSEVVSETVP
ncbi:MAG: fibronectin type III domain-containing protein [Pyrinomonadaceae bacterium]|nr:fibronectin type III domain-containing protein [Pyrinomonadaceae bacterium]